MSFNTTVPKRSIIYVDGFNLYYGALKGGSYKWLDLQRYFELLRPNDDIQAIRYFTAALNGPKSTNQETYHQALATRPLLDIIFGKFKTKQITCRVPACSFPGSRVFTSSEEKRTDVNIAILMLDDAYRDLCDRLIVVSGDSDLVPAINQVKTRFPHKEVIVYVPARHSIRGAAVELRSAADKDRFLPLQILSRAQFPVQLPDSCGKIIRKPASW